MLNTRQLRQMRKEGYYDIRKENHSGLVMVFCVALAFLMILTAVLYQ